MRRSNEDRLKGGHKPKPEESAAPMANPMDFITPSEFVELPSKGRYPEGHPLCGKDSIEIRYMTAKDEDILTNRSLLKKGLAIDRLIQNLIIDKSINARHLYVGDRNAIIVFARASAYGKDYKAKIQCPACGEHSRFKFDLGDYEMYDGNDTEGTDIQYKEDGTFTTTLPLSNVVARIRPLMGQDELDLVTKGKAKDITNDIITKQMKYFVVDFNGYDDKKTVDYVCENMVATDSRYLRDCFRIISPDIQLEQNFVCKHCEHEEVMTVPFGTDFFWPDR